MEKILNFEEFSAKLNDVNNEAEQARIEAEENTALENELEEITETALPELFAEYEILEAEQEFKVTEPAMSGDAITLKINNQKYKFVAPEGKEIDIKEIFRKFQKMMGFAKAGGKALAWLHKQLGKGEKIA